MGFFGDRYEGEFGAHKIELYRDNVGKKLSLSIDGKTVAWESRFRPHEITLQGEFEHNGEKHTVVAHSVPKTTFGVPMGADDTIEVDGKPLPLKKA